MCSLAGVIVLPLMITEQDALASWCAAWSLPWGTRPSGGWKARFQSAAYALELMTSQRWGESRGHFGHRSFLCSRTPASPHPSSMSPSPSFSPVPHGSKRDPLPDLDHSARRAGLSLPFQGSDDKPLCPCRLLHYKGRHPRAAVEAPVPAGLFGQRRCFREHRRSWVDIWFSNST